MATVKEVAEGGFEEFEEEEEEKKEDIKLHEYTDKIMEEDFLWDMINMLHDKGEINLKDSFDEIKEKVLTFT